MPAKSKGSISGSARKIIGSKRFLRVFHLPENCAGVPNKVSEGLRELGARSFLLTFHGHPNYPPDKDIRISHGSIPIFQFLFEFVKSIFLYDTFQFWGRGLFYLRGTEPKSFLEKLFYKWHLPFLRLLRKRIFFWYLGCDIRIKEVCLTKDIFCARCSTFQACNGNIRRKTLEMANHYAHGVIISQDPDHLRIVPRKNRHFLPVPFKMPILNANYQKKRETRIRLLHAPTKRSIKGTEHVLSAVEELKTKGIDFSFVLLEGQPHRKVLEEIKKSDIVLDQFYGGSYGTFALEAMSMGKPVLGFVTPIKEVYPDLPIIDTYPDKIVANIETLINNPEERQRLGMAGRKFVERYHESRAVIRRLVHIYLGIRV